MRSDASSLDDLGVHPALCDDGVEMELEVIWK
jgi:hypothetical protein